MPVIIPDTLPAKEILNNENIFVMGEDRAIHQDIRPLKIAILNLMPTKIATETQLLRLIGNSPLQVEITLLRTATHESKNTPEEHLLTFYQTIDDVEDQRFDGLIITGAPVEHLPFEEVDYWDELKHIMDWRETARLRHAVYLLGRAGRAVSLLRRAQVPAASKRCLASSRIRSTTSTCRCSAALMMCFTPRIRAIPKSAARISRRCRSWRSCRSRKRPGCTSSPRRMGARSSSPGIPNTTR